jgi:hypothetical protein
MKSSLMLSTEDLGRLLAKAAHEPRRNLKRFLKDRGGQGSAEELDFVLAAAGKDREATAMAARLDRERAAAARNVEMGMEARVAEMLADVQVRMAEQQLTQQDVADRCGWSQPQVAAYVTGKKEPGARNLAKLASAVGCVWRLLPID